MSAVKAVEGSERTGRKPTHTPRPKRPLKPNIDIPVNAWLRPTGGVEVGEGEGLP